MASPRPVEQQKTVEDILRNKIDETNKKINEIMMLGSNGKGYERNKVEAASNRIEDQIDFNMYLQRHDLVGN